ncbi:MAG: flagellar hook-basal body complex protein FliE [Spirochaetes bacterium]|nr:flagellar hook-basal body complex protein FliE [Spirochaetota bacterium]
MISSIANVNSYVSDVMGQKVTMKTSDVRHFQGQALHETASDDASSSFKDVFNNAISKVNNLQIEADDLRTQMIYEPESVDIHTVEIAAQKAEIALMFAKTVRDQAISAYREMINLR